MVVDIGAGTIDEGDVSLKSFHMESMHERPCKPIGEQASVQLAQLIDIKQHILPHQGIHSMLV